MVFWWFSRGFHWFSHRKLRGQEAELRIFELREGGLDAMVEKRPVCYEKMVVYFCLLWDFIGFHWILLDFMVFFWDFIGFDGIYPTWLLNLIVEQHILVNK